MKKVLMVIAPHDFRDEEYQQPFEEFKKAGFKVSTVSTVLGEVIGMLGGTVISEGLLNGTSALEYDAVVFIGGAGASMYFDNAEAHKLAVEASEQNRLLGAICIAPVILANAGLLKGRKATVWKDQKLIGILKEKGAEYTGADVVKDGKIITAAGPFAAREFGKAVVKALI
ncbi:MAG: DJ-1/PfpI family protein [Candidatus Aenigmatarchaeota archaeon]